MRGAGRLEGRLAGRAALVQKTLVHPQPPPPAFPPLQALCSAQTNTKSCMGPPTKGALTDRRLRQGGPQAPARTM
jgi:hypothetical protein